MNGLFKDGGGYISNGCLDQRIISLFLRLPSLRELTVCDVQMDLSIHGWACEDGTSNTIRIILSGCSVTDNVLIRIIQSCRATQAFKASRNCRACSNSTNMDYAKIKDQLDQHSTTLTDLSLSSTACRCDPDLDDVPLGSLSGFEKLSILNVAEKALYARTRYEDCPLEQLLPEQLQKFFFDTSDVDDVESLVRQAAALYLSRPSLLKLQLDNAIVSDSQWASLENDYPNVPLRRAEWVGGECPMIWWDRPFI